MKSVSGAVVIKTTLSQLFFPPIGQVVNVRLSLKVAIKLHQHQEAEASASMSDSI